MPDELSDIEIWNQLRGGESQALLSLYNAYYIRLMNFGARMTSDRDLTNDCISQVLIKLWNRHENLPRVENVGSYLVTCLKNELLSELKNLDKIRSGNNNLKSEWTEQETSYEEYLVQTQTNAEIKNNLKQAFSRLTKREKQLLQMKFFDDLSYEEIALQCNITKRTAYNIIHAALKTLKADLKKKNTPFLSYDNSLPLPFIILSLYSFIHHLFNS
ncbi:MAG TPA: sigma-70 family RNA polymerase sigma factor [Parafilimonas sp.]|nr:sigma-70 family RNA polymerase sigma factor [Parafilimonas sp.]